MRCLTLADHLKRAGHQTFFICRDHEGNLAGFVREHGHPVHLLSSSAGEIENSQSPTGEYASWLGVGQKQDAEQTSAALRSSFLRPDWLVVDHYAIDQTWLAAARPHVGRLFVIDDLANRLHDCDMLLDHNLNSRGVARYDRLVPAHCARLLGPEYALLRDEFVSQRKNLSKRDGSVRNVLVFFGGVDPSGETLKTCEALTGLAGTRFAVKVIAGTANPRHDEIRALCAGHSGFTFLHRVNNMAELMAEADLAIGAGGTTTWERAYLGLPTIALWVAENQREGTEAMAEAGALWNLGRGQDITPEQISNAVVRALSSGAELREMSRRAYELFGRVSESATAKVARLMQEGSRA